MALFTCDYCGKCCLSFGAFITIERQLNERDYYSRYALTGDLFPVHVDRDYIEEVVDRYSSISGAGTGSGKKACPFLCRRNDGGGFVCAVYDTRPAICREFRCYRMLIYDDHGCLKGKVIGTNEIRTSDGALARLWKDHISAIVPAHRTGSNDPAWVKKVTGILAAHGYRGDAVD